MGTNVNDVGFNFDECLRCILVLFLLVVGTVRNFQICIKILKNRGDVTGCQQGTILTSEVRVRMSSPVKRPRREGKSKDFYAKASRKSPRNTLDVGDKGWMVTCNFKEKDSVRKNAGNIFQFLLN